jgi:nucleolar protein 9
MNGPQPSYADNDPSSVPEPSDYIATLLRDPTSSHLLETLVSRCPESVFDILWTTYFERSLRKLAMHPVANFVIAKALERANAEQLSYTMNELRGSLGKLRRTYASHILSRRAHHCSETRIGILRALIERAAALNALEDEICEVSLYYSLPMLLYDDTALGNMFCFSGGLGRG